MAPKKHQVRKFEPIANSSSLPNAVLYLLGTLVFAAGAVTLWGLYQIIKPRLVDISEPFCGSQSIYLPLLLGCSMIGVVVVIYSVCSDIYQSNKHRNNRAIPTKVYTKIFLIVSFIIVLGSLSSSAIELEKQRKFCKEVAELGQTPILNLEKTKYHRTTIFEQVGMFIAYNLKNHVDEIYIMYGRRGIGMTTAIKNNFYNLLKISHDNPYHRAFIYYADLHEIDQFLEFNDQVCLFNFFKSVARTGSGLPKFSHNTEQGAMPKECTMEYLRDQIIKLAKADGQIMFLIDGLDKITNYMNFLEMFKAFMTVSEMTSNRVRFIIFSNAMHQQLLFKLSHNQVRSQRAVNPEFRQLQTVFNQIVNIDRSRQEIEQGAEWISDENQQVMKKIRAAKQQILALCETFEEVRTLVEEIEFFMLGQQDNNITVKTAINVIKQKVYERQLAKLEGAHWQEVLCLVLDKDDSLNYYKFPRDMYIYLLVNFHILFSNVQFQTKMIDVVLREKYYPGCCKSKYNQYSTNPISYEYRNCSDLFKHKPQ